MADPVVMVVSIFGYLLPSCFTGCYRAMTAKKKALAIKTDVTFRDAISSFAGSQN
ncbi:MAG: hypothetical protein IPQ06_15590 [Chitinophagaceae bacterium]|nr:hypothetical protein [Chitinophagaceae bacterium]